MRVFLAVSDVWHRMNQSINIITAFMTAIAPNNPTIARFIIHPSNTV